MLFMDELENFKPVRDDHPKDIEKFADLLDIAVINLKEAKREEELGNGTFYRKLQRKLPERLLTQYQRWIFENKNTESVESLRKFIVQEAEFQVTAGETIHGLHVTGRSKHKGEQSFFGDDKQVGTKKKLNQSRCIVCSYDHALWNCNRFKQLDTDDKWRLAKENKLCYKCLGSNHTGSSCTKMRICGINGCKDSHNRLLHRDKLVRSETSTPTEESKRNSDKTQNFIEGERSEKTMHATKPIAIRPHNANP